MCIGNSGTFDLHPKLCPQGLIAVVLFTTHEAVVAQNTNREQAPLQYCQINSSLSKICQK